MARPTVSTSLVLVSPAMILRRLFIATALALIAAPSLAVAADFEGKYTAHRGGYRQEAEIARAADGTYKVGVYVGIEGCSGAFEGIGKIEGAKLIAHLNEKDDACRLVISRTRTGVKIEEDGCITWHGASCDFNGTLRKR
jgi:hypothetical protein